MKQLGAFFKTTGKDLSRAAVRFPLTVLCLAGVTAIACYLIHTGESWSPSLEKLFLTLAVAAVLSMAAQFAVECVPKLGSLRAAACAVSAALSAGFFLLLRPAPKIGPEIGVRSFVAVFALICVILWLPPANGRTEFNRVALTHFKAVFTSILYAAVLSGGIAAVLVAVDALLFKVDSAAYLYMLAAVWGLFAGVCDLSLLPEFGFQRDAEREERAGKCPRFLEILISYISIPLMGAYTAVLAAYFVKILVTRKWPSGQLGPLVLAYSAAGLILLVLAGIPENRFAAWYRRLFPKVLIPIVLMQLISVGIRLRAYGVTESRYYLALFGVFSLVVALILSIRPAAGNRLIALLAAVFAVLSILPPADAFSVSRHSQITRLERILQEEGMLRGGVLTPKPDASEEAREETSSILSYLDGRDAMGRIPWLPQGFALYEDMDAAFGFPLTYYAPSDKYARFYTASDTPLSVSGYDISAALYSGRYETEDKTVPFAVGDAPYLLFLSRSSGKDARVSVRSPDGTELVGTELYGFAGALADAAPDSLSEELSADEMTLDAQRGGYRLRIVFRDISVSSGASGIGADYDMTVLFGAP